MSEEYSNTENKELINRIEIKLRNVRNLSTYYNELKTILDKPDYEKHEDNSYKLDEKGQKIPTLVKPMDVGVGEIITDDRRNKKWTQYKSLAEELLP